MSPASAKATIWASLARNRAWVGLEKSGVLRSLNGLNIVGGDVVEVAPSYDSTTNTAQNAAQVLFDILSLMYFSPSLKQKA